MKATQILIIPPGMLRSYSQDSTNQALIQQVAGVPVFSLFSTRHKSIMM